MESATQLLERLKFPTFYNDEVVTACDVSDSATPRASLALAVKPVIIKGNSLIQLSYRAKSAEEAGGCLEAVLKRISLTQNGLGEPVLANAQNQLVLTKNQLEDAEKYQTLLDKRALTMDVTDAKFSQSMVLMTAALSKRDEIARLRKLVSDQSTQLLEPSTQGTRLLEPMYVPDSAIFPKKTLTALGGLLGGLVLGGVVLFVRRSWLSRKST